MQQLKTTITPGLRWWATTALKRRAITLTAATPFPVAAGTIWPHDRFDRAADYLKSRPVPFEQAIPLVEWFSIDTALGVLEALGNPGQMTVADLHKRLADYMHNTERADHVRAYTQAVANDLQDFQRWKERADAEKAAKCRQGSK